MIYPNNFEQKIGFDQVRHIVSGRCLSTLGKDKVDEMQFATDSDEVARLLDEVTEFVRIIQEEDTFPYQYFFDVRPALQRASIVGMYMDEGELFDLRRSLDTISQIITFFRKEDEEEAALPYPNLTALTSEIQTFPTLIRRIDGIVNKFGKIKDNASPTLAGIRRELAATTGSISRTLNSILRSAQAEGIVDKDVKATVPLTLKQPFISIVDAPEVIVQETEAEFIINAEAAGEIAYYIFGTNFFTAKEPVEEHPEDEEGEDR